MTDKSNTEYEMLHATDNSKHCNKQKAHIVSHTHWDREWRYPIWETITMLVEFMDELIDLLEKEIYPAFLLDGQVRPVLDYLQVRPENTNRIKKLISDGKLEIGPWYVLPDEYPVDGEALVRNLIKGYRISQRLGKVLEVGYTPFGWGQTAQLPQIYKGFDFDVAMIGKKVSSNRAPDSEFIWQAPDGSEILTTRFGELGRQNFYLRLHLSTLFNRKYESSEWQYCWSQGGVAYHRCDNEQMEQDHFRLDQPEEWKFEYITPELIKNVWDTTKSSLLKDDRLMMNGCDYSAPQKMMPELIRKLNEIDTDKHWFHTSMRRYIEVFKDKLSHKKLKTVKGELRDGPAGHTSGNALSTRLYLKRLNKHAQNLLIRSAEPLSVIVAANNHEYPAYLMDKAWNYLLLSHPHDSINGVTQDKTAGDVVYRLNQVIDISQTLINLAMKRLISQIDLRKLSDDDVAIVVFNTMPYSRREVFEAWLDMPDNSPKNPFWPYEEQGLLICDLDGNALSTQWHGYTKEVYPVAEIHNRAMPYNCQRHHVYFDTGDLPPMGYKVFKAVSIREYKDFGVKLKTRLACSCSILKEPNVLENEYIKVMVNSNGTFDIHDKENMRVYKDLNYFEDKTEMGDYWASLAPMHEQTFNSLGCSAKIWSEDSGPLQATIVSEIKMDIPVRLIYAEQKRIEFDKEILIRTYITLKEGSRKVDIRVEFENRCEDHWLRVIFPTGLANSTHAHSGGHFNVDKRPIKTQGPEMGSYWPDMKTLPCNNFVDISDGSYGFALIHDSMIEYEVMDNQNRILAMSLLRSVKNWITTGSRVGSYYPSQKGGQSLGKHVISYAILPHKGDCFDAKIPLEADKFNVSLNGVQTRRKKGGNKKQIFSFLRISNPHIRMSCLKKAEDSNNIILRLYNSTETVQTTKVFFFKKIKSVWRMNLNEKRLSKLNCGGSAFKAELPVKKIVTIEIEI